MAQAYTYAVLSILDFDGSDEFANMHKSTILDYNILLPILASWCGRMLTAVTFAHCNFRIAHGRSLVTGTVWHTRQVRHIETTIAACPCQHHKQNTHQSKPQLFVACYAVADNVKQDIFIELSLLLRSSWL